MHERTINDEEIINDNELLKDEIAQIMRNAMSRFDQTTKWNITFDVIFEKVETGQITVPHPTFHDMASPSLNINEIDDKITKTYIKLHSEIAKFYAQ